MTPLPFVAADPVVPAGVAALPLDGTLPLASLNSALPDTQMPFGMLVDQALAGPGLPPGSTAESQAPVDLEPVRDLPEVPGEASPASSEAPATDEAPLIASRPPASPMSGTRGAPARRGKLAPQEALAAPDPASSPTAEGEAGAIPPADVSEAAVPSAGAEAQAESTGTGTLPAPQAPLPTPALAPAHAGLEAAAWVPATTTSGAPPSSTPTPASTSSGVSTGSQPALVPVAGQAAEKAPRVAATTRDGQAAGPAAASTGQETASSSTASAGTRAPSAAGQPSPHVATPNAPHASVETREFHGAKPTSNPTADPAGRQTLSPTGIPTGSPEDPATDSTTTPATPAVTPAATSRPTREVPPTPTPSATGRAASPGGPELHGGGANDAPRVADPGLDVGLEAHVESDGAGAWQRVKATEPAVVAPRHADPSVVSQDRTVPVAAPSADAMPESGEAVAPRPPEAASGGHEESLLHSDALPAAEPRVRSSQESGASGKGVESRRAPLVSEASPERPGDAEDRIEWMTRRQSAIELPAHARLVAQATGRRGRSAEAAALRPGDGMPTISLARGASAQGESPAPPVLSRSSREIAVQGDGAESPESTPGTEPLRFGRSSPRSGAGTAESPAFRAEGRPVRAGAEERADALSSAAGSSAPRPASGSLVDPAVSPLRDQPRADAWSIPVLEDGVSKHASSVVGTSVLQSSVPLQRGPVPSALTGTNPEASSPESAATTVGMPAEASPTLRSANSSSSENVVLVGTNQSDTESAEADFQREGKAPSGTPTGESAAAREARPVSGNPQAVPAPERAEAMGAQRTPEAVATLPGSAVLPKESPETIGLEPKRDRQEVAKAAAAETAPRAAASSSDRSNWGAWVSSGMAEQMIRRADESERYLVGQMRGGTPIAEVGEAMRKERKPTKAAEVGANILPADRKSSSAREAGITAAVTPVGRSSAPSAATPEHIADLLLEDLMSVPYRVSRIEDTRWVDRLGASGSAEIAERIGRLESLISREVVAVRQLGAHSLSVMLRPDADTELMVQLQQNQGMVEAAVKCDRGDMKELQAHWSMLREALAEQNIRLLPLQSSASTSGDSHQNSFAGRSFQHSDERAPRQGAMGGEGRQAGQGEDSRQRAHEPALATARPAAGPASGGARARGARRDGWEFWA